MTSFLIYLIQSSLVFSCLYLLYIIVGSRVTFHKVNRFILLLIPVVALLTPLSYLLTFETSSTIIQIPQFSEFVTNGETVLVDTIEKTSTQTYNFKTILFGLYILGSLLVFLRLLHSLWLLFQLKKRSEVTFENNYQLIQTNHASTFSFFNWIFISKHLNPTESTLIIAHEKAHVQLKHSIDVLFAEAYIVLFWFNPLVYTYRKSLKAIHEYQADSWVLNGPIKTSNYLQALLQNIEKETAHANNLYSYFNQSVIKKRIDMITKKPTAKVYKLTYSVFIMGAASLCLAFTKPNTTEKLLPSTTPQLAKEFVLDPPTLFPVQGKSKNDISSSYGKRRNPLKKGKKMMHKGIDIKAPIGTPVIATADGVVAKAADQNKWGNLIVIEHSDGYQTWYAHLQKFNVTENQSVKKGDVIGYVGNTGASLGSHLHYEVHYKEAQVNPINFFKE
ncbi:peptidoglycan DD-metalloendopeptidase family protein [Tenacibaculum larymnensis]|uniref:Peptidoglycan DD-metalloendopeptidase family protein n=1 Tax=Tenacibaculum larymnensis TaxID=2878201 RepID=A0A9X4ER70_9FLAO|nr:peptidoglycan DD-metalloendopeptidase family protein [Tenacibaculum larymnensis]MDE1206745.1 peptidoglycan DD-metalloendopeptidase family protein [Tenacibaculum larymnensis]